MIGTITGTSAGSVMSAHLTSPIPDPGALVPSLHPLTRKLITTALAKKPTDRYLTHEAFIAACEGAIRALTSSEAPNFLRKPMVLKTPLAVKALPVAAPPAAPTPAATAPTLSAIAETSEQTPSERLAIAAHLQAERIKRQADAPLRWNVMGLVPYVVLAAAVAALLFYLYLR